MSPTPLLRLFCCLFSLLVTFTACAQDTPGPVRQQDFPKRPVESVLENYRQKSLTTRRFKQSDLQPILAGLPDDFVVDTAGVSVEGRPLYRVTYGTGSTEVLLWSQMHGDEPTATAALFDLFNWLAGSDEPTDSLRREIRAKLHLTFLPMLNPDGAEVFERRNALGIDLNRDAVHLTSPEARVLKAERDRIIAYPFTF